MIRREREIALCHSQFTVRVAQHNLPGWSAVRAFLQYQVSDIVGVNFELWYPGSY